MNTAFAADEDADEEEFVGIDEFVDIDSADDIDEFVASASTSSSPDDEDEFVANASAPSAPDEDDEFVAVTKLISDSLATAAGLRGGDLETKELRRGRTKPSPANGTVSRGSPRETQPSMLATASLTNPNSDVFMRSNVARSSPYVRAY